MCVICRRMLPKAELTRVVNQKDGTMLLDPTGKMPGRGAYICREDACRAQLKKKKTLNKVFKRAVPEDIYEGITRQIPKD